MKKVERGEYTYFLDGYVYDDIGDVLTWRKYKWDAIMCVIGREGAGKSTLGAQVCLYADPTFNLDRVVFTPEQFKHAIMDADKGQAILYDEAITGADSAMFRDKNSIEIVSLLTQVRRKQLFIVICFPYLFKLNRYFVTRSVGMFYAHARGPEDRGYLYYYNNRQMNIIYGIIKSQSFYQIYPDIIYTKPQYRSYYGTFTKMFPLDEKAYDEKKDKALKDKKNTQKLSYTVKAGLLKKYAGDFMSMREIARRINSDIATVSRASMDGL